MRGRMRRGSRACATDARDPVMSTRWRTNPTSTSGILMFATWACYIAGVAVFLTGAAKRSWEPATFGLMLVMAGLAVDLRRVANLSHRRHIQALGMLYDLQADTNQPRRPVVDGAGE